MAEQPKDTEQIVQGLTNLDTARMTVRWALERIRFLEQTNNEMLELMRQARLSKDEALKELETARKSADKRLSTLAQKERFVSEMQGMLNSLFKGEVDLKQVLDAKNNLEEHKAELEAKAKAQIEEAEARTRHEADQAHARAASLEASYARALEEAENRYQEQLKELQRQRQQEGVAAQEREARFKEKLLEEVQKQAEQYHQKLSLLQFEFSARRQDLQKEYDELKEKLFQEAQQVELRQVDAFRLSREHWDVEKKRLENLLHEREAEAEREREQVKAEAAAVVARREAELREIETRLREDISHQLQAREAELSTTAARRCQEAAEARERESLRAEEAESRLADERSSHREELAALQAGLDARLAQAAQEQMRVRDEEAAKRLTGAERVEADFRERLARANEEFNKQLDLAEARRRDEVSAAHAAAARLREQLEEAEARARSAAAAAAAAGERVAKQISPSQLEARLQDREGELRGDFEQQLAEAREAHRKARGELEGQLAEAQAEIKRLAEAGAQAPAAPGPDPELAIAKAEIQRLTEAHAKELEAAAEENAKLHEKQAALRQAFDLQLEEAREAAAKAAQELEARLAAAPSGPVVDLPGGPQDRIKKLEEENRQLKAQREKENAESANRLRELQERFEQKLAAEVDTRASSMRQQWAKEKAEIEKQAAAARDALRSARERADNAESKAKEGGKLADTKVQSLENEVKGLITRLEETELRAAAAVKQGGVKKTLAALVALFLMAAGARGGWLYLHRGAEFPLPASHPAALAWSGSTLWVADKGDNTIYRLALTPGGLAVRQKSALPGVTLGGLAVGKEKVFIIDAATGQIQQRALDAALTLQATIASPGPKPSALYYDGQYLWSADRQTGLLYQHADDETLSVIQSFNLGPEPAAIQMSPADGKDWWWLGAAGRLYGRRATASGGDTAFVLPELDLAKLSLPPLPFSAFAWKDGRFWAVVDGQARVYERPAWRLRKR
ncbi:MAG: hypothetical protein NTX64_05615 [Elusimicrobia bacterium]|nr:hypothetical protein [Elusimicrobiota bacterium]